MGRIRLGFFTLIQNENVYTSMHGPWTSQKRITFTSGQIFNFRFYYLFSGQRVGSDKASLMFFVLTMRRSGACGPTHLSIFHLGISMERCLYRETYTRILMIYAWLHYLLICPPLHVSVLSRKFLSRVIFSGSSVQILLLTSKTILLCPHYIICSPTRGQYLVRVNIMSQQNLSTAQRAV